MASINNQATLRVAVADWLNRGDLTTNQLDQFIEMGEAMIYETLRVPPLEHIESFYVAGADSNITIPANYLELQELRKVKDGTCSVSPTTNTNRSLCSAASGVWTDNDKDDDVVLRRVDSHSFHNNKIPNAFTRESTSFFVTDENGEQKAEGDYLLKYYKADLPIGTLVNSVEVSPYILGEYELILYSALAFGSSFLGDGEAEARFIGLVNDKINRLNSKASIAEMKGGIYSASFSERLI